MGEASAAAQGLTKPITTAERLRNSEHAVYLLIDQNASKWVYNFFSKYFLVWYVISIIKIVMWFHNFEKLLELSSFQTSLRSIEYFLIEVVAPQIKKNLKRFLLFIGVWRKSILFVQKNILNATMKQAVIRSLLINKANFV